MQSQSRFQQFIQNDPQAKQKIIFFLIAGFLVLSLLFLVFFINTRLSQDSAPMAEQENSVEIKEPKQFNTSQVDFGVFPKLNKDEIGPVDNLLFLPQTGEILHFDPNLNLVSTQQTFPKSEIFVANSLRQVDGRIVVNQEKSSSILLPNTNQFVNLENTFSIIEYANQVYFLEENQNQISVKVAANLNLLNPQVFATVLPQNNSNLLELKVLNNRLYLVTYEARNRKGEINFYHLENNTANLVRTLVNVKDLQFGTDKIMYTLESADPSILTNYRNYILDFSQSLTGQLTLLEMDTAAFEKEIYGTIAASRCALEAGQDNIICAVKREKVELTRSNKQDALLLYNYQSKTLFELMPELRTSIARVHLNILTGELFLITQEEKALIKVVR